MRRTLTISEEFNVWHVEADGREVVDTRLVNALAKSVITSPHRITLDVGGTKLALAAGVIEALMPPKREDGHEPQSA